MEIIDLHTHSIFSDGKATPEVFVKELYKEKENLKKEGSNLKVFSLTDHDTMNGIEPMERALEKFERENNISEKMIFLRGIEISTQFKGHELHVLGYFPFTSLEEIDKKMGKKIQANLEVKNKVYRENQLKMLLDVLSLRFYQITGKTLKYNLDLLNQKLKEKYLEFVKKSFSSKKESDIIKWNYPFPRNIIREVLSEFGIAPEKVTAKFSSRTDPNGDLKKFYMELNKFNRVSEREIEAFVREDIGRFKYLPEITERLMKTVEAVELIASVNGIPIWAHPYEFINLFGIDEFERFVREELVPAGLRGIECYYPDHGEDLTKYLINFSKKNNLLISGGTDTHLKRDYERFGVAHTGMKVPIELYFKIVS